MPGYDMTSEPFPCLDFEIVANAGHHNHKARLVHLHLLERERKSGQAFEVRRHWGTGGEMHLCGSWYQVVCQRCKDGGRSTLRAGEMRLTSEIDAYHVFILRAAWN
jgi:hypothetical protein